MVKVMPKGRCGLKYCLSVGPDDPRSPLVLDGDPQQIWAILEGVDFANPYTSVALCFERAIKDESELRARMTEFEGALLPGLRPGVDYALIWIRHNEHPKDPETKKPDLEMEYKTSLHAIIPNVFLMSGKRLQPYFDRIDRKRIEAWQELTNIKNGYASPKDPDRERAAAFHAMSLPRSVEKIKSETADAVEDAIAGGHIKNRDDLLMWLSTVGYKIERVTKKSISVSVTNHKKNIRLEGSLYENGGIERALGAAKNETKRDHCEATDRLDHYTRVFNEELDRKRAELERQNGASPRRKAGRPRKNDHRLPENAKSDSVDSDWQRGDQLSADSSSDPRVPGQHGQATGILGPELRDSSKLAGHAAIGSGLPVHGDFGWTLGDGQHGCSDVLGSEPAPANPRHSQQQHINPEIINHHELNTTGGGTNQKNGSDAERARGSFERVGAKILRLTEFFKRRFRIGSENRDRINEGIGSLREAVRCEAEERIRINGKIRSVIECLSSFNDSAWIAANRIQKTEFTNETFINFSRRLKLIKKIRQNRLLKKESHEYE